MVTIRDIIATAPEFSALEADVIQQGIVDAYGVVTVSFWADLTDTAARYLACHLLAVSNPGLGAPGVVSSERVGPIARTYAVGIPPMDEEFMTTRYGRRYSQMVDSNPAAHMALI